MARVARTHKKMVTLDFRATKRSNPSEEKTASSKEMTSSEEETLGELAGEEASESQEVEPTESEVLYNDAFTQKSSEMKG